MEGVVAQFVANVKDDEQRAGDPDGKARNVDQGKSLMPQHEADHYFQIILYHGVLQYSSFNGALRQSLHDGVRNTETVTSYLLMRRSKDAGSLVAYTGNRDTVIDRF